MSHKAHSLGTFKKVLKCIWLLLIFHIPPRLEITFRGEHFHVKEREKSKEGSDRYLEEQFQRSGVKEPRSMWLQLQAPLYPPPPKHTHPQPPQEAGKEEVSWIDVHLTWCDFLPACEKRHRGRREQKRSVGWGSQTQLPCPGSLGPWQAASSHPALSMHCHNTGSTFSHSLIPPPAPELI